MELDDVPKRCLKKSEVTTTSEASFLSKITRDDGPRRTSRLPMDNVIKRQKESWRFIHIFNTTALLCSKPVCMCVVHVGREDWVFGSLFLLTIGTKPRNFIKKNYKNRLGKGKRLIACSVLGGQANELFWLISVSVSEPPASPQPVSRISASQYKKKKRMQLLGDYLIATEVFHRLTPQLI